MLNRNDACLSMLFVENRMLLGFVYLFSEDRLIFVLTVEIRNESYAD